MEFTVVASDVGFTEGPVFAQDGDILFTSIDRGCVYRARDGETAVHGVTGGGVGRTLLPPPPPPQADNASAMAAGNKVPASRSCRCDARFLSISSPTRYATAPSGTVFWMATL